MPVARFFSLVVLVAGCSGPSAHFADDEGSADGSSTGQDAAGKIDAASAGDAAGDAADDARDAAGDRDAGSHADAATGDGATQPECEWGGAPGSCLELTACAAIADHSSEAGSCPGPANIQCCIVTPNVQNNPPTPAGYKLMTTPVSADMTAWAVTILHDPVTYPMFSTTTRTFGTQLVLARVEWHPPDFQNSVIHRGVTLYVPV